MSNFSFSHSVFKRLVLQTRKNQGLFGKELNIAMLTKIYKSKINLLLLIYQHRLCWMIKYTFSLSTTNMLVNHLSNKPLFLHVYRTSLLKCNKQFLLFPQCFLPIWITFCHFHYNLQLLSANSFSLEESKIANTNEPWQNGA